MPLSSNLRSVCAYKIIQTVCKGCAGAPVSKPWKHLSFKVDQKNEEK